MTTPPVQLSPDCQFSFEEALLLLRNGRPDRARVMFEAILRRFPDHFDSNNLLGVCLAREGRHAEAIHFISRALAINPTFVPAYLNLAAPLMELGRFGDVLASADKAIAIDSASAELHQLRGNALRRLGRTAEAVESHARSVGLQPERAPAQNDLGAALLDLKRNDEALECFRKAIRLDGRFAEAHNNCGIVLRNRNDHAAALACFSAALAINPEFVLAQCNLARTLFDLGRVDEALSGIERAIAAMPGQASLHLIRGNLLYETGAINESLASYDTAIGLDPGSGDAHISRGTVLHELGDLGRALGDYDRAASLSPGSADPLTNKAIILLKLGDLKAGFELYSRRFEVPGLALPSLRSNIPKWDGRPFKGRLLLWREQGLGDEILFASLLSLIPGNGMTVTLLADRRLHPIFRRSFPGIEIVDGDVVTGLGDVGAQAAIGELGALLKVDSGKLGQRRYPYLAADPARRAAIRQSPVFAAATPVCGIAWRSAAPNIGARKSVGLVDLAPLVTMPGMTFVNLQYGDVAAEIDAAKQQLGVTIHQIAGLDVTNDIDGLLALIDACDVVFTTSNVTAHLAGAMGKSAVVMLPRGNARLWYWDATPGRSWYPSLRLVEQQARGDWQGPIGAAVELVRAGLRLPG